MLLPASFAQFERRLSGQRPGVKKVAGVRLGRPPVLPVNVQRRIARARSRGQTYAAMADALTRDRVPSDHGVARPYPLSVRAVERRVA